MSPTLPLEGCPNKRIRIKHTHSKISSNACVFSKRLRANSKILKLQVLKNFNVSTAVNKDFKSKFFAEPLAGVKMVSFILIGVILPN